MEKAFAAAWAKAREQAAQVGVRMRPVAEDQALQQARRCLDGHRLSDGFQALAAGGHLAWSLEALAVNPKFTGLFTDEQANEALTRLLEAGYRFESGRSASGR